jgi:hypothetical protein
MFSINSPELESQHLKRFMVIELKKPDKGADFRAEHAQLVRDVEKHALCGTYPRHAPECSQAAIARPRQGRICLSKQAHYGLAWLG